MHRSTSMHINRNISAGPAAVAVLAVAVVAAGGWLMAPKASASTPAEVSYGSQGTLVRTWQADLDRALPAKLATDGIFGPLTEQATEAFQTDMHIGVDGIVGPVTWGAMNARLAGPGTGTGAGSGTGAGPGAGTPVCATGQLRATLGASDGTAGSIYVPLVLTNIGTATCETGGYPGVSYVTGNAGTQVGSPAQRVATVTPKSIVLAPGQQATATVREVDAGAFPDCTITATRGLRVYPPNQFTALFVAEPGLGCANPAITDLYVTALEVSS